MKVLFFKALEPGERWITVHPHGPGTTGQPVLIQPTPDGAYKVIGGAGGALAHLKITGVKSEASYAAELKQRSEARKAEQKRQRERDRAAGTVDSKARIAEGLKAQLGGERVKLVEAVAKELGWRTEDLRFPVETKGGLSPEGQAKAEKQHAALVMKAVMKAGDFQRQQLLAQAERRMDSLGEIPMTSANPAELSVQDLDPVRPGTKGFGFSPDYAGRAGMSDAEVEAEARSYREPQPEAEPKAEGAALDLGAKVAKELTGIRDVPAPFDVTKVVEATHAMNVVKAIKQYREVEKEVRAKVQKLQAAETVEPKAYVIEVANKAVDREVVKGIEDDLRTIRTRGFLNQLNATASGETLGRSVGAGAYNSVNALALAAGGASLIDRSVVDVLGVAGAAQVLARRLHQDLTPDEMQQTADAMAAFHVDRYMALSEEALREARELQEAAHEIEIGEARNGGDFQVAQEMNAKRRDYVARAQDILGTAAGEMEANAALVVALQQKPKQQLSVSLGKTTVNAAIRQARAIGLQRGDYSLTAAGSDTVLQVYGAGLDRLADPVSRADLQATRESLAIINGRRDEENWLPEGVSNRPDLALNLKPGVVPRLAKPFDVAADPRRAVEDYIGGRTADGDSPADVMAGLLSEDIMNRVDRTAFLAAINKVAPLYGPDGQFVRVETHTDEFEHLADDFVSRTYGATRTPLARQTLTLDEGTMDALHRALAAHPDAVAAFKPIGELTPQDEGALRMAFVREYGRTDPAANTLSQAVVALDKQEPPKQATGLFGLGENPDWTAWKAERDAAAEKANAAAMTWGKYVETMGSPEAAYAAMQDVVRSGAMKSFADAHNTLHPDHPVILGRQVIRNDLRHLDALDPKARERRQAEHARLIDRLRNRVAGRYGSGSVKDKETAIREAEEAVSQSQMGLFAKPVEEDAAKPLGLGERYTIGHAAERQIAGMMPVVGANFRPGEPVQVFQPTMSGQYAARQRAVKLIEQNKHMMLGMGVGSGKTAIMLSSFTDLKSKGATKKGLFLVPSVVQGQFHGEALKILKPGAFRWQADPSADRATRLKAYKDPANDFTVVTHQAFREDFDHVAEARDGMTSDKFDALSPQERRDYAKGLMAAEGWNTDFLGVDEGHSLLNRRGKENSHLANVVDAISANTEHYVNATADPIKNDASEAFDLMAKMEPDRYRDRDAFLRKYGVNTAAAKDSLRREMARHFYTSSIDPGVAADRKTVSVDLGGADGQKEQISALDDAAAAARLARMQGRVDVAALKTLAPYAFEGVPEARQEEVATRLQAGLGMIHATAVQHAVSDGAKIDALVKLANERKGKPGVVFVHRLDRVEQAAERLKAEGHRVVTLTGADSAAEKDRKKRAYQAGEYDIMVASDAGAVGANLQAGKWLVQFDTPQTAMLHAQRNGRIHRIGQDQDVELIDLVANHPSERKALARLETKYALRDIMTSPLEGLDETGLAGYLAQARAGTLDKERPAILPVPEDEPVPEPAKGQMELAA